MEVKGIIDEDFVNYKKPSMYIAFPNCSFKCDLFNQCKICQNSSLAQEPTINIDKNELIERYLANPITEAFVLSGLEPFDSILDLLAFVNAVRNDYNCHDDIVIYTGYTEEELLNGRYDGDSPELLREYYSYLCHSFDSIIIKFGRFIMNDTPHKDEVLGVELASRNQYAREVSTVHGD